jgi:hypothetical protein
MINCEQIQEMIDCYGANLDRWPCAEKKAIAIAIENDASLSNAFLKAKRLDRSINEQLELSKSEWMENAEKKLSEKIIQQLDFSREAKSEAIWWSKLSWLAGRVRCYKTVPVVPAAVAVLVLLATVQLNFQDNEQLPENSNFSYTVAELDEWLVFEGLETELISVAQQNSDELTTSETQEIELSLDSELIFYL